MGLQPPRFILKTEMVANTASLPTSVRFIFASSFFLYFLRFQQLLSFYLPLVHACLPDFLVPFYQHIVQARRLSNDLDALSCCISLFALLHYWPLRLVLNVLRHDPNAQYLISFLFLIPLLQPSFGFHIVS